MLNGLAVKLFGLVPNIKQQESTLNMNDDGNFDEWVLLDDDVSERGSCDDDLDLLLTSEASTHTSGSPSPRSTVESRGWNLAPPPCFVTARGQNKYKNVKHRNPNLIKSLQQVKASPGGKLCMDVSVFGNMLIEYPSLAVYQRPALTARQAINVDSSQDKIGKIKRQVAGKEPHQQQVIDNADQENQQPVKMSVVESKVNPVYVVTGVDVCAKAVNNSQVSLTGKRLEIQPEVMVKMNEAVITKRRAKRQHFTLYDATVFNNRGKQRKYRLKKTNAGR